MDRKVIRSVVWDYIIITVGALLYVVAWTSFLIPNGIASGGLTGACTIIEMATRGLIPVGWSVHLSLPSFFFETGRFCPSCELCSDFRLVLQLHLSFALTLGSKELLLVEFCSMYRILHERSGKILQSQ